MSDAMTVQVCCFRDCGTDGPATLRLVVTPPPDGEPVTLWAHDECFAERREAAVEADDPRDHGRIPSRARCVFCGEPLPIVGRHPLVFDAGDFSPPHRFWAHAACMLDRLGPEPKRHLSDPGRARPPE